MSNSSTSEVIDGILLVNKPQGLTSNAVLQKIKRLFNAKKAGHTGSLDPLATGMLPLCFGEGTKLCQYVLDADKTYQATGLLGSKTTTADAMGAVIASVPHFVINEEQLQQALNHFSGHSLQTPSMFSALKHKGVPLYKYAREGKVIVREPRPIEIKAIQLDAFDGQHFTVTVTCSKGTYIRNLIEDIGDYLGVGAHVTMLHRLNTAGYVDHRMYGLEELMEFTSQQLQACLLPLDTAVVNLPHKTVNDEELITLQRGQVVSFSGDCDPGCVRLYSQAGSFVGLGTVELGGILKVKRLLSEKIIAKYCTNY